jgi:hypothetical protein
MSSWWLTRSVGGNEWDSNKRTEIPIDNNRYPTHLPFTAADGTQHFVHTIIPCFTAGQYTLVIKGKGRIYFRTPSGTQTNYNYTLNGGTTVIPVNVPTAFSPQQYGNTYSSFLLEIQQSDASDPIRDIKLVMPNFYNATTQRETEVFHPLFKQSLAKNSLLRYMDFGMTNGSPMRHFSERTKPTSATQSGPYGVSAELMSDLGNELQKDIWICMPHRATDDYVTQLANVFKNRFNSNQKIYIEYSNETWNTMFSQTTFVQDTGQALGLSADRWEAGQLFVARRSGEIFKIFQDIFGENGRNRLVFVMGAQNGSAYNANTRLNGLANPTINPSRVRADALATAPYIGMIYPPESVCNGACIPSIDALIAEARNRLTTETAPTLQALKTVADNNFTSLICYEGGQHLVGLYEALNYQALTDSLVGANHDPRMYGIYDDYLTTVKNNGVQMFANFASCGAWSKYGSWGLKEFQTQADSIAHKYRAVQNWIDNNPFTADNLPPSVPTNFRAKKIYDASILLNWSPSTDNVGVTAYTIALNGKTIGLTSDTTFEVKNLLPNTAYTLSIQAKDKAMNYSTSAQISATTLPAPNLILSADFTGTNPATNAVWQPTSTLSNQVTYSGIARAAGIVAATDRNNAYCFSITAEASAVRSTLADARRDSEYVSFRIAPLSNKAFNLNDAKMNLKIRRLSGASPQTYVLYSSIKGFETGKEIYIYNNTSDFSTDLNDLVFYFPEKGYKYISDTVEFRIYMYNAQYGGHRTSFEGLSLSVFEPISDFPLGNLTTSNLAFSSVDLSWSAVPNASNSIDYSLFKNGIKFQNTPLSNTHFSVTNLTENLPYIFFVRTYDADSNILYQTQKAYITTPSRNPSYNLVNFAGSDATTTLSFIQRTLSADGTAHKAAFNTASNGQFFNTNLRQHQFSGGFRADYAPNTLASFSGTFTQRSRTDGYEPNNLIISATNGTNPTLFTAILMWTKDKFNNAAISDIIKFDNTNNTQISVTVRAMSIQNRAMRFVIRNKNIYYISEKLMNASATHTLSGFSNSTDTDKKWAVFDPTLLQMPNPLPTFTAVDFDDVQEVGIIYEGSRSAYGHSFMMTNFSVNGLVNPVYVLPIEILDFQGIAKEEGNFLTWKIGDIHEAESIVLEKSENGKDFTPLSIVSKNQDFYLDKNYFPITYYRLKIKDLSGKIIYSKIISLQNLKAPFGGLGVIKIYPNPVSDILTIENLDNANDVEIINILGQTVLHFPKLNDNKIYVSNLENGVYFLKIEGNIFKLLKE